MKVLVLSHAPADPAGQGGRAEAEQVAMGGAQARRVREGQGGEGRRAEDGVPDRGRRAQECGHGRTLPTGRACPARARPAPPRPSS